jgi:NAD(P)-dependent dehydrogenase (short-subunit alcohol dehydrogenase family)
MGAQGVTPYTVSKHGVIGLTRSAALEYGAAGVRVNAVCPGYIDTPLMRPTEAVVGGGDEAAGRRALEAGISIGRYGRPDEIAAMVAWLLSDEATYANGGAFSVDAGMGAGLDLSAGQSG